jgi:hypothetical protein
LKKKKNKHNINSNNNEKKKKKIPTQQQHQSVYLSRSHLDGKFPVPANSLGIDQRAHT